MTAIGGFWERLRGSRSLLEPRPFLLPLVPAYLLAARAHRAWMRLAAERGEAPRIPLIVIGALRAGGSGKTSVVAEMARRYRDRGLRVAVLAYRLGKGIPGGGDPMEVEADTPWRAASEEAVLLKRLTGARVFATRDRARAWRALSCLPFDLVLSDDGFQDPRLDGAFRMLLQAPGEDPGLADLLPAGPYRETRAAAARAHLRLSGPLDGNVLDTGNSGVIQGFSRRLLLPPGVCAGDRCAVLCGLGDNRRFLAELAGLGLFPEGVLEAPDHGTPAPGRLAAFARRHAGAALLCTRKDLVKLEGGPGAGLGFRAVDQAVSLDAGAWAAADRYRAGFPLRNRESIGLSSAR